MSVANYRDLIVWQRAMELATLTYALTEALPPSERFGLALQIRRAAVSIPSNIAEGHGRGSPKALASFVRIANGSLKELETQLLLSTRLNYLRENDLQQVLHMADEVGRMLTNLRRSVEQ